MIRNSGKILLVEDNRTMTLLVKYNLEKAGYSVDPVGSAESALEYCRLEQPDLIISDIQMPGMSGLDFRQIILADARLRKIPFVFLTASAQEEEISQGRKLGVNDYLTKPFKVESFLTKIGAILETGQSN